MMIGKDPDTEMKRLLDVLSATGKNYDVGKITKAYEYASKLHEGQLRVSGEAYITHPLAVAQIVAGLGLDTDSICAAITYAALLRLNGQNGVACRQGPLNEETKYVKE